MRRSGVSLVLAAVVAVVGACTPPSGGGGIPTIPGTFTRVTPGDDVSGTGVISGDGQWVAFVSSASNFGGAVNDADLFLWERATNTITRITASGNGRPCLPRLSADGKTLVFLSMDDLGGSPSSLPAVYLHDRVTETTHFVGESTPSSGCRDDGQELALSADGNTVVWTRGTEVLSWDRATETTTTQLSGDGVFVALSLSPSGQFATFASNSTNLDASPDPGIFVAELGTPNIYRARNLNPGFEMPLGTATDDDGNALINVLFDGGGPNLIGQGAILSWTRATQTLGTVVDDGRVNGMVGTSADGRYVTYLSFPSPLDTTPLDGGNPLFPATGELRIKDRTANTVGIVRSGRVGVTDLAGDWMSANGNTVLFGSNDNVVGTDNNGIKMDLFVWQRS